MHLYQLIYASTPVGCLQAQSDDILSVSSTRNAQDDITGALMLYEAFNLQLLEGERDRVTQTFDRIMRDDRHQRVTVMVAGETTHRLFSEWEMLNLVEGANEALLRVYFMDGRLHPFRMTDRAIHHLFQSLAEMSKDNPRSGSRGFPSYAKLPANEDAV